MAVLTSAPFVTFLTCMWIFALASSSEDTKTIKAMPGDDVTLQCQSPRDAVVRRLEWKRADLETDGYVFFFRENRPYEDFQHPSFSGRVQLRDPETKDGDASVILKNVNINDTGTYECCVKISNNGRSKTTSDIKHFINLTVEDSVPEPQLTPARPGDNVTLPCRAPNNVTIATVEWTRSDLKKFVYFQQDGRLVTEDQDPSFVNRVQLTGGMKDGDLSLILKNMNSNDGGTYECRYVGIKGRRRKRAAIKGDPISIIKLDVEGKTAGNTAGGKHTPLHLGASLSVGLTALVILAAAVGLVNFKKSKGHLKNISDQPVDEAEVHQKLQENENSQSKTITHNISDIQV